MADNQVSFLESQLISKTMTFARILNEKNPKTIYFLERNESLRGNWINIYINTLESRQVGIHYQKDTETGKIIITGDCPNHDNTIFKDYTKFIIENIPEIADRVRGY